MTMDSPVVVDLSAMVSELLAQARTKDAGRASRALMPGTGAHLSQTLMALVQGHLLDDHTAPGPATIQVLDGTITVTTATSELGLSRGQWAVIPDELHGVRADSDAALLLTVAAGRG